MNEHFVLELCAGAGGQAIGLEMAGFVHAGAIDIDTDACKTLRLNRPQWHVVEGDISTLDFGGFRGVDLIAGGLPCPPFSIAGKQLGLNDERNLFPHAIRIIDQLRPAAVLLENVPGFASAKFTAYRQQIIESLEHLGYTTQWQILNAADYGVPQLRPRFILVAFYHSYGNGFKWPLALKRIVTVSQSITDLMASRGWNGIDAWQIQANKIAPTLVGGSKKHGGPDLGPTRAKKQWELLHVDGHGLADLPPDRDFPIEKYPRLTVRMAARLQDFPDSWVFSGKKTAAYRQVGNAFPPSVAYAVGKEILQALKASQISSKVYRTA